MGNHSILECVAPSSAVVRKGKTSDRVMRILRIAVAVAVVIVGTVLAIPPVMNRLFFDQNYVRIDYDSFEAMVREEEDLLSEEYSRLADSHLSSLTSTEYEKAEYFLCVEKNPSPYILPQLYFAADLKKDGVRTEIVYSVPHVPPMRKGLPKRFWGKAQPSSRSARVGETQIPYSFAKNRIECALIDETGSYLIYCHSGNAEDLIAVLEDLLDRSIDKNAFS